MRWAYKHHSLLRKLIQRRLYIREFLLELSWTYAHYLNPDVREKYGWTDRHESFWGQVKCAWRCRIREE